MCPGVSLLNVSWRLTCLPEACLLSPRPPPPPISHLVPLPCLLDIFLPAMNTVFLLPICLAGISFWSACSVSSGELERCGGAIHSVSAGRGSRGRICGECGYLCRCCCRFGGSSPVLYVCIHAHSLHFRVSGPMRLLNKSCNVTSLGVAQRHMKLQILPGTLTHDQPILDNHVREP
jgi:hypothetical protein